MDYEASALLASIRRRGALPTASAAGVADADLLALVNEELQSYLVPLVMDLREEYFVFRETRSTVAGRAEYRLPYRAVGAKLREVELVTETGGVRNLARISLDELEDWPQSGRATPQAFYFRGATLALVPTPNTVETLRLTYYLRPGELTATASQYRYIDEINGNVVTTSAAHGYTTAMALDFVKADSPFETLAIDVKASGASGDELTFDSLPPDLAVGDYACRAEKSPVPQLPAEFHPLLAQRVVVKVMETLGMQAKHELAARRLAEMEEQIRRTFAPRVDGEPKVCAPGNDGLMGGAPVFGWWRGGL